MNTCYVAILTLLCITSNDHPFLSSAQTFIFVLVLFSFHIKLRDVNYFLLDKIPDDVWFQVVMVFDSGPHGVLRGYIKGEAKHGDLVLPDTSGKEENSGDVVIGRRYVDSDFKYCSTMVDELMLWNRSLTPQEAEYLIALY